MGNQPAPDPAKAYLSLVISVSSRIVTLGEPVFFIIVVNNTGGAALTTVVVLDALRGLTLLTPSPGIGVVGSGSGYTIIQGTVASLNAEKRPGSHSEQRSQRPVL